VLWSISPLLFGVAIAYAAVGSLLTILLGRPLVWLNYNQSDQEANLRSALIHVRANAESLVFTRREPQLGARLLRRLDGVVANFRRIITVNRNLGFFTTGYNYLIQIIPALIVAPMFIRGNAPFGVITQSAMAFGQLLGAFSLIVTQFQSISSFAAVVARIGALAEGIERAHAVTTLSMETCPHGLPTLECPICLAEAKLLPAMPKITIREEDGRIAYERLTLELPPDGRVGVRALSLSIPKGTRTLVLGEDEAAKMALLWATAGVWETGEGRVIRPSADRVMFLPERPYLPPGTLRELLMPPNPAAQVSDEDMLAILGTLQIDHAVARAGGLDVEENWDSALSLSEQQLLSVARVVLAAPQFVFLHRIGTTLGAEQVEGVLSVLSSHAITYIALEHTEDLRERCDAVLQLAPDGTWTWNA